MCLKRLSARCALQFVGEFARVASESSAKCTGKAAGIAESDDFCYLSHGILAALYQVQAFIGTVFFQITGDRFSGHFFEKTAADFS